ncbi:AfsR/SARP family transcriptional regulator [Streptomyces flavofungini]|uniref:AfsR/SARP family transcriptional regulator n=1 Tax=Streptomyces flavofungini TaxID=68200 RepID=A0ABS0XHX3_9ACTN|nr:BTAD domain-containing putative transcriptional regulator [Streptomyces flavofungini]MBJ3812571.1 AfsR/SARP family transcriptional regulator [Streptomyces flavofungini]GHC87892.1 AfsR family transcriptional regulator [Streptomyces flavofungini]
MRYQILGATQAHDDQGTPLPVGGPRLRSLLAALALRADRTTPVDTLIDDIWADTPPADAPAALQALVGRLRRALGRGTIASEPGGYRLTAPPDAVDLHRFERLTREGTAALDRQDPATAARLLREALSLWHGPALADLPDRTAATRPEARRQEATRARAEAELLLGRAPDVVPELKELTTDQPYDEALRALLIRALRDAGRGADALAAYEEARRTLAEELGTDPGPELRALHAELLAGPTRPQAARGHAARGQAARVRAQAQAAGQAQAQAQAPAEAAPDARRPTGTMGITPPPSPRPPTERQGNLRPRLTSFVGREPELGAIRSDMRRARLVTLTGPGGSGKTRLAEEAAAGQPSAWLAELAPLDRPEAVPGAVVSALGLRETVLMTSELTIPHGDPLALLVEYCAPRSLLLILDNCEHVIGAAAELAETLLTRCPDLTIVATSREPLGVPGECVRPVEPLPPTPAHRLFAERAEAVRPGFDPAGDAESVAEICRRLDGLPLAIELAAARLRMLTPRQIADRLDDRFRLLTSGSRTVLPRQQTLRAVVDWSWDLLDAAERTVLREVSVFAGGWDLEAAEAVCSGSAADLIGALVDKSLVVAQPYDPAASVEGPDGVGLGGGGSDGVGPAMRYRLLETIHEYAAERAAEPPQTRAEAERRHSAYFRALVETAEPLLRSAGQLPWIHRLETDLDNLRAAFQRSVAARDEELATAFALGLGWFWWLRNYRTEGSEWVGSVLGLTLPPGAPEESGQGASSLTTGAAGLDADLANEDTPVFWPRMSLRMLHLFLTVESRPSEMLDGGLEPDYIRRVRNVFIRPVPEGGRFPGLVWPFTLYFGDSLGWDADVLPYLDLAVSNCRRFGGDWEVAITLMFRVHTSVDRQGNLDGVDEDLRELRELSKRVGDRWLRAQVCSAVGEAAMARSHYEEARGEYDEALRLAYEVGAYAEAPFLIARLAEIAYRSGDRELAVKGLEEANIAGDRYGVMDSRAFVRLMSADMALGDGDVARARALCDEAREASERGTLPPQFAAGLGGVEARITAAESTPGAGLAVLAEVLPEALHAHCSELVVAGLVDTAAVLVSRTGDHARATRLLTFATHWRAGYERPMPDRAEAEHTARRARAALGDATYEQECAAGEAMSMDTALEELTAMAD